MTDNTCVVLARSCDDLPTADDFRLENRPTLDLTDGQVRIKVFYVSLDPYLRSKIAGRHMSGAVHPGDIMAGEVVGEIVESRHSGLAVGQTVRAMAGWQSHAVMDGDQVYPLKLDGVPLSLGLGILGMPGLTAYAGITRLSEVKEGETYLVSAASGPVGSMSAQLAKLHGARTVGIAGSEQKCTWLTEKAGFADTINYKEEDIVDGIKRTCPDGVDIYFDAVGGAVLDAACENLAIGGRVILCGLMSEYNSKVRQRGPGPGVFIRSRATVRGLVVYDHEDLRPELEKKGSAWVRSGDIVYNEDMTEGLENAPTAFARLMRGQNFGKSVVKVI